MNIMNHPFKALMKKKFLNILNNVQWYFLILSITKLLSNQGLILLIHWFAMLYNNSTIFWYSKTNTSLAKQITFSGILRLISPFIYTRNYKGSTTVPKMNHSSHL